MIGCLYLEVCFLSKLTCSVKSRPKPFEIHVKSTAPNLSKHPFGQTQLNFVEGNSNMGIGRQRFHKFNAVVGNV
jgi:hypothetical protein